MASRHVSTALAGLEKEGPFPAWEDDSTLPIPKWLMVLAARGEVTLRVQVDLEDDPIAELDDTASGD